MLIIACISLFLVVMPELHQPKSSLNISAKQYYCALECQNLLVLTASRTLAETLEKSWKETSRMNWCTGCVNFIKQFFAYYKKYIA